VLLLFGAFVFAFCLGEAVHELGHYLAHRANGVQVGIKLDPFGGSRILGGASAPPETWGITSAAGPLLNLLAGVVVSLSLWGRRTPGLLPFVLWGPVAMVQEGVTFSLGLLTPGGDAQWIVEWGVPAPVVVGFGVLLLAGGVVTIGWLLPLLGLSPTDSFGRKLGVVAGGMVAFMIVRLVASAALSSSEIVENSVPLVFSLLLAAVVVTLYGPLHPVLARISGTERAVVTWRAVAFSAALAVGVVSLQLAFLN
jgi:hypothetical protein